MIEVKGKCGHYMRGQWGGEREASDDVIVSLATTVPAVFPRLLHYGVSNLCTAIPLWLQCMHNVTEGGYIGSHCQPYDSGRSHVSVFDQFTYGPVTTTVECCCCSISTAPDHVTSTASYKGE